MRFILSEIEVVPLTSQCIDCALDINETLKRNRNQIELADLLIAATAVANDIPLATLNTKHFNRIKKHKVDYTKTVVI